MPMRINRAKTCCGIRRDNGRATARCRIVEADSGNSTGDLEWRIDADVLFVVTNKNLLMVDTIAGTDRSLTCSKRIPSQADAWSKVGLFGFRNIFTPRRNRWSA